MLRSRYWILTWATWIQPTNGKIFIWKRETITKYNKFLKNYRKIQEDGKWVLNFFCPMPPHVLVDFVVLPPGHGRSVTDFWGWDAHEAQLRCPDDASGYIGGCNARRALKPTFYQSTQTMVIAGFLPFKENSHGRAGNRTRDLMISSQRLWTPDHEGGQS